MDRPPSRPPSRRSRWLGAGPTTAIATVLFVYLSSSFKPKRSIVRLPLSTSNCAPLLRQAASPPHSPFHESAIRRPVSVGSSGYEAEQGAEVSTRRKRQAPTPAPIPVGWMIAEPEVGVGPLRLGMRQRDAMVHVNGSHEVLEDDIQVRRIRCKEDNMELIFCGRRRLDHVTLKPNSKAQTSEGIRIGMTLNEVKEIVGKMVYYPNVTQWDIYFSFKKPGIMYTFDPAHGNLTFLSISDKADGLASLRDEALSMGLVKKPPPGSEVTFT